MIKHTLEQPIWPVGEGVPELWGEIVGLSATLPFARIEAGIRPCREIPEDPEDLRFMRTKERQPVWGEAETCLGGPYIRLRLQPDSAEGCTNLQVFAHNISAGACAHRSLVSKPAQTRFFKEVNHSVHSFRRLHKVLGAEAASWMEVGDSHNNSKGHYVAQCLGSATCIRLVHAKPGSVGVSTALRNAPPKDLLLVRNKLQIALQDVGLSQSA